jgi:hypothetical protein
MKRNERDDELRGARIAEALREPVEAPDVTDAVMSSLTEPRRSAHRYAWALAAACLVAALAVLSLFHTYQASTPRRFAIGGAVLPRTTNRAREQGRSTPNPTQLVAKGREKPTYVTAKRTIGTRRLAHSHERVAESHVTAAPMVSIQPERATLGDGDVVTTGIVRVGSATYHVKQTIHIPPPNPDANVVRPELKVVRSAGVPGQSGG